MEDEKSLIPEWVYKNLDLYGNSLISRKRVVEMTKTGLLNELKYHGYDCSMNIIMEAGKASKSEYPVDANYILELKKTKKGGKNE